MSSYERTLLLLVALYQHLALRVTPTGELVGLDNLAAYLTTYPWQVAFRQPLTVYDYGMASRNGETRNYPLTPQDPTFLQALLTPEPKPVLRNLFLWVKADYGRTRQLQVRAFLHQGYRTKMADFC